MKNKVMNYKEFEEFLNKFQINEKKIYELWGMGKIVERNENIFITQEKFDEKEVYHDYIIFIKLNERLLPSKFLLNWIGENSKTVLFPKNEKIALDFTFSKDIFLDHIANKVNLQDNIYYVVSYDKSVLGYVQKKQKRLINKMNIGEYLRE